MQSKNWIPIAGIIVLLALVGFGVWRVYSVDQASAPADQVKTVDDTAQSGQSEDKATSGEGESKPTETASDQNSRVASGPRTEEINGCTRTFDPSVLVDGDTVYNERFVTLTVKGFGKIKLKLNGDAAPKTVQNFLRLSKSGFYDCLTFHRVAKDFVIQGGDPSGDGTGGPGYTIPAEIKLKHERGSIAMARLSDQVNPERESSGSQFYIALNDLAQLDGAYTVFGEVVSGLSIVDKIGAVPVTPEGAADGQPKDLVIIEKAEISAK
jgi:cyclophilin family peptidyl-prolyl cis-trans isomerase